MFLSKIARILAFPSNFYPSHMIYIPKRRIALNIPKSILQFTHLSDQLVKRDRIGLIERFIHEPEQ